MTSSLITAINEEHRTIAKLLHLIDRQVMLFPSQHGRISTCCI